MSLLCSQNIKSDKTYCGLNPLIEISNNEPDNNGWTPIHQVSFLNDPLVLKWMVTNKFEVNVVDKTGNTPIMAVLKEIANQNYSKFRKFDHYSKITEDKLQCFAILLENGAKLDYFDQNKRNIFHILAIKDFNETISSWLSNCVITKTWQRFEKTKEDYDFSNFVFENNQVLNSKDIDGKFNFIFYLFNCLYLFF